MLKVLFGKEFDDVIYDVDEYFNNTYDEDWFINEDKNIVKMVKDIDNSQLIGMNVISPVLGSISLESLSGGVKTLIMMYKTDNFITDLSVLGNNCRDWLLKIAEEKDITASINGFDMHFEEYDKVNIMCLNDGEIITKGIDWSEKLLEYIR